MATLLLLLLLTAFFAALGRSAIPRDERLPWWTWTLRDLTANVVRGIRVLADVGERQRWLWDRYLDESQPWHRRSGGAPDASDGDRC